MRSTIISLSCALLVSTLGCAHEGKPAGTAAFPPTGVVTTTSSRAVPSAVTMSNELRAVCGIEDTGTAPKFDFDAAVLGPSDRTELDQLARCMTTGPLAGKNLALVGRADPRGEAEYNMTLGARRADAVEHYLAQLGVASSRLVATSRGALDAQGRDEPTWAIDRRVDLRLAGH